MATTVPYLSNVLAGQDVNLALDAANVDADDDLEDSSILDDIGKVAKLMAVLRDRLSRGAGSSPDMHNKHGADLVVRVDSNFEIPAHRVVLVARCVPLREVLGACAGLSDNAPKVSLVFDPQESAAPSELRFTGITPISLLILPHYLYTDEVLAVWDRRIGSFFEAQLSSLGSLIAQVKVDLGALADLLHLPHLTSALQYVRKRVVKPSAGSDFQWLFDQAQAQQLLDLPPLPRRDVRQDPLAPDVALYLADEVVYAHSTVLRARSGFFSAFFDDPEWTSQREDDAGVIDVQMRHFEWRVM